MQAKTREQMAPVQMMEVGNMSAIHDRLSRTDRRNALPPGPRMPSAVQAAGWALRPLAFMDKCRHRYGETFTLRVRRNRPWVFLTDPEHVKQVSTTNSEMLGAGAGEANPLLEPLLGPRSVMLLD